LLGDATLGASSAGASSAGPPWSALDWSLLWPKQQGPRELARQQQPSAGLDARASAQEAPQERQPGQLRQQAASRPEPGLELPQPLRLHSGAGAESECAEFRLAPSNPW